MVQPIFRKDFDRALRDFKAAMTSILAADRHNYEAQVNLFIELIDTNPVLNSFMQPYFSIPVEIDEIVPEWGVFDLPSDINKQIAYMLKVFRQTCGDDYFLLNHIHTAFCVQNINQNYFNFNRVVVQNCYNKLLTTFEDYLEDHFPPEPHQTLPIPPASITLNHYEIKDNHQSNIVANGAANAQAINTGFTDKVLAELLKNHNLEQGKLDEIKEALKAIENAQSEEKANTSLLSSAWEKIYSVGGKIALQLAMSYLTKPEIIQTGYAYLMTLIK